MPGTIAHKNGVFEVVSTLHEWFFMAISRQERLFRILTQNGFDMFQRRVTSNLSKTAKQRYREFRRHYPGLEHRKSQKHIASYLGITAAFLSMMRKEKDL